MKSNQLPKIAVLLAAYNGEKYIQEQIESIVNQVDVDAYIYISIDASTDRTLEICQRLQKTYKNIFIINEGKERFGSAGKNFYYLIKNVEFKEFDYIALSDQDDIWKKNKLSHGVKILKLKNCDGYSSDVECFWADGRKNLILKKSYPQKSYDYFFEPAGPGCTYILTKKITTKLQEKVKHSLNLPFHHDWFIYAYARCHDFKWHIDNTPNIFYRQHETNQVGANIGIKQAIKRIKQLKNKTYKNQVKDILKSIDISEKLKKNYKNLILIKPFSFRRKNTEAIILLLFRLIKYI